MSTSTPSTPSSPGTGYGVTQEMLRAVIWGRPASSKDSQQWRDRIKNSTDQMVGELTYAGGGVPPGLCDGQGCQDLVYGLLHRRIEQGGPPADPSDQIDLARWLGTAMAFGHNKIGRSGAIRQRGVHSLYSILDFLVGAAAGLPWAGRHTMPQWAQAHLGYIKRRIERRDRSLYRPWNDVQKNLLVFLTAFQDQIQQPFTASWDTDGAVLGALSLRLLASQAPGLVSDELVE